MLLLAALLLILIISLGQHEVLRWSQGVDLARA